MYKLYLPFPKSVWIKTQCSNYVRALPANDYFHWDLHLFDCRKHKFSSNVINKFPLYNETQEITAEFLSVWINIIQQFNLFLTLFMTLFYSYFIQYISCLWFLHDLRKFLAHTAFLVLQVWHTSLHCEHFCCLRYTILLAENTLNCLHYCVSNGFW